MPFYPDNLRRRIERGKEKKAGLTGKGIAEDEKLIRRWLSELAEGLTQIHEAQLITYLRLSRVNVGLLLNFNVVSLKNGIRRLIWQAGKTRRHPLTP